MLRLAVATAKEFESGVIRPPLDKHGVAHDQVQQRISLLQDSCLGFVRDHLPRSSQTDEGFRRCAERRSQGQCLLL